jgi:tryptophan-rich sensory protein
MFWRRDRLAGALLVPYLVWVTYAATLSIGFAVMNAGGST